MTKKISPQLEQELASRISQLEAENKYFQDFWSAIDSGGSSSVNDASGDGLGKQIGVTVPKYMGFANTFVANPSNVGIGIIARMIETDDTVLAAVQFKSLMMLSKIGEYQNEDKKVEEFVRRFLSRMQGPSWIEALEAMSSHGGYGFSVSEIIWGLNKENKKIPVKVKTYHPSTICFEVDPYGDVTENGVVQFIVQHAQFSNPNTYFPYFQYGFNVNNPFTTPDDRLLPYRMPFIANYGIARIPKNKVIHHVNNPMLSFGSPYGKTPVRTAHLAWQLKVFFMKQMGIAGKRMSTPFIWGTAPHAVNKVKVQQDDGSLKEMNPVDALSDILARRQTDDSVVTGPETAGYKLTSIAQQLDMNGFIAVLGFLNTQIFRAFLLPSLVMTDGTAGSRSLGDKHFQIVDRIAENDAQKFSEVIVSQMIRRAIDENFGEQDNYGHFAQRPQSIEERERMSNMFASLSNAGFIRPYDEVDGEFVRSSLHLPKQEASFYEQNMPNFDGVVDGVNDNASEDSTDDESEKKDSEK